MAFALVAKKLHAIGLRRQKVRPLVPEEIREDRSDFAGAEGNAAAFGLHEAVGRIEQQQAIAGTKQNVGTAIAVHVRDQQTIAFERPAAVLQQRNAIGAKERKIDSAVAVKIDRRHADGARIDAGKGGDVREPRHSRDRAKLLHAPAGEIALGIVFHDLEAGLEPLQAGGAKLQCPGRASPRSRSIQRRCARLSEVLAK